MWLRTKKVYYILEFINNNIIKEVLVDFLVKSQLDSPAKTLTNSLNINI